MTAKSVVGIEPATGKVLWTHVHETKYDIHAVTPAAEGNVLYYTGGYGSGGGALDVSEDGTSVKPKWSDSNLDCQHHGVIVLDGYVYGTGHENNKLMCLELATGKLMWITDEVTQGDIAYADEDGYFYVVDRLKELIKYKGYQVAPAELEAVLLAHPAVADVGVVRYPDDDAGEIPKAFVVARAPVEADELMAWVAERVAPYKKVRMVEFIDVIPKSPSGKILRRELIARDRQPTPVLV